MVLTYVHLPPAIRRGAHQRLARGLRPGGWLLLECFHPLQLSHSSGGPKDAAMLYEASLLRDDFAGWLDEVEAWEGEVATGRRGRASGAGPCDPLGGPPPCR